MNVEVDLSCQKIEPENLKKVFASELLKFIPFYLKKTTQHQFLKLFIDNLTLESQVVL